MKTLHLCLQHPLLDIRRLLRALSYCNTNLNVHVHIYSPIATSLYLDCSLIDCFANFACYADNLVLMAWSILHWSCYARQLSLVRSHFHLSVFVLLLV